MEDSALIKGTDRYIQQDRDKAAEEHVDRQAHNRAKQRQAIGHKEIEGKCKADFQAQKN